MCRQKDAPEVVETLPVPGGVYRLNPVIELVKHTDLHRNYRVALDTLAADEEHFGFLLSRKIPELGIQAVNRKSAYLFSHLRVARTASDLPAGPLALATYVLDGILEVRRTGEWVSGPAAYRILFDTPVPRPEPADEIASLSYQALRLAQQLPTTNARRISSWLYRYNTVPLSSSWGSRIVTAQQRDAYLGLEVGGATQALLDSHFMSFAVPGWRAWRVTDPPDPARDSAPTFKLYVSPHPSAMPEAFARAAELFVELGISTFKLGSDAFGLLRPDKLVAYFENDVHLEQGKSLMAERYCAFPAQGVPFTASVSGDALLSWGIDPPRKESIPGWQEILSWRKWIADRLARTILRARVLPPDDADPWQFALARLTLDGVNIENWTPYKEIWK